MTWEAERALDLLIAIEKNEAEILRLKQANKRLLEEAMRLERDL